MVLLAVMFWWNILATILTSIMRSSPMSTTTLLVSICLINFLYLQSVHASWWYLGLTSSAYTGMLSSSSLHYKSKCSAIDVLATHQKKLCSRSKNILDVVSRGAGLALDECQFQFLDRRWNCTTFNSTEVFGGVLHIDSREKAYIYAISSAGVMHAITKSCSRGELNICGCDTKVRSRDTKGLFMWGGCSENARFGFKFTREFVDFNENRLVAKGLMNLWNNNAGRNVVKKNMKLLCKCHGVSGSCSVKICWRTMAGFHEIGTKLKNSFDGASRVRLHTRKVKLRPAEKLQKRPDKEDLVYLQESPDYCEYKPDIGSLGTRGRLCNRTSYGLDGCQLMCCGRGYYTIVKEVEEDCECKFFWCCRVECLKCRRTIQQHYCN